MQLTRALFSLLLASSSLAVPVENNAIVAAQEGLSALEARAPITGVICRRGVKSRPRRLPYCLDSLTYIF